MSLIADALKAAQEEKSRQGAPDRAAARRFLASSVTVGGRRGEAVRWEAPAAGAIPRPVRIAAGVFALATLAAVGFVVLAPRGEGPPAPGLAAVVPPAAEDAAAPAPVPSAADHGGAAPEEVAVTGVIEEDPAEVEAPFESRAVEPAPRPTAEVPAVPAPAPATATAAAADAGRFQLRLEPTRAPAVASSFEQALAAQRRRDYPAAIALYERALLAEPGNAEALNNLGATYQAAGDLPSARDAFRRALAVNPGFAAAWSNLAVVLGALGEAGDAQAALAEAIRLDPSNHGAKVNLALQYQRQGLVPQARRLLEQVVQTEPQMAEAHYALGRLLEEQGDRPLAVRHYKLFLSTGAGRFAQLDPLVRQRVIQLGGNPDAR